MMDIYLITSLGIFILTFLLALGLMLACNFTARRWDIPIVASAILFLAFTAVEGAILAFIFADFSLSNHNHCIRRNGPRLRSHDHLRIENTP